MRLKLTGFWTRFDPIWESLATDCALDLSQAIDRCIVACKAFLQCVTPHGRLFLRRARRWLIGPEAARAQGFVLDAVSELYSHKEVIDLFGNGFAASSLMTAILGQLTLAVKLGRIVPPLVFRIFQKLVQYISTCILACASTAYFDFYRLSLRCSRVLL